MIPTYSVHTLRVGSIRVEKSAAVQGGGSELIDVPIWVAAIEGYGSKILVDTGLRDADKWSSGAPHSLDPGETLHARLADLGWRTRDIDIVINSHLHYDHSENNLDLADAQFFVSRAEWDFAHDPSSNQVGLYDVEWTSDVLSFLQYTLIQVDDYDVLPGLRVIRTPGHTPGHQSVLVNTDEGILCVAGDAACLMENLTVPAAPGLNVSAKTSLESIARICGQSDRILMNHDPSLSQFQNQDFPKTPDGVTADGPSEEPSIQRVPRRVIDD
ncbi:N-acyl homoserine lactonase family protein [Nocardioides pocheonensis]|uniref:N-acyl homoserine lactonase family protein n=1 Tax=Nocardioides pocheonensis TaxID=661485 RepID=A0A3N0GJE7_9ACTN|nr:N-acyl homoserine lactonase family protein [Nocardioides pocheonensis]RNM12170.1 N-acyl homoserine lactonase family protein [Nocardioides pocheonensis]